MTSRPVFTKETFEQVVWKEEEFIEKEIEKVLSVYVDGRNSAPAVYDTDNKILVEANIKFSSKTANSFDNQTIRRKIFKSCNLRETKPFRNGRITREEFLRFRNDTGYTTYF